MNNMNIDNIIFNKRVLNKIAHLAVLFVLMFFISPNLYSQSARAVQPLGEGITAKSFSSSTIDNNNVVWFLTDSGIISFNGTNWNLYNNPNINAEEIKDFDYATYDNKDELWIAGSDGASVVTTPFNAESAVTSYSSENSDIKSNNVISVVLSKKTRWFATEKGISAFVNDKWLTNNYDDIYPEDLFDFFPISTMTASKSGDTIYVGTFGGGVMRFYKDDVDAVSGASEFAEWGPILMPSDNVFSVYIAPDGTQWIGTDKGVAKHSGNNTLEGWTILDEETGLANNEVLAINSDTDGKMYFGTSNGLSVFDGTNWNTYRIENGLISNNILTIAIDKNNVVWLGTDNGVTCFKNGEFVSYQ